MSILGNVCDHPQWKLLKLNSSNYAEGERLVVTGCFNSSLQMKNPNQILICEKSSNEEMKWRPDPLFEGEFCEGKKFVGIH